MVTRAIRREAENETHPSPFDETDDVLARQLHPRLYCQITQEEVSFGHVAKAWWIGNNPELKEAEKPQAKRTSVYLEHLAREKFARRHRDILEDFWTNKPWAACALTGDGWVHSVMNSSDAELVRYEAEIHQLCRDAHRTFERAALAELTEKDRAETANWRNLSRSQRGSLKAWQDLREIGEMLYEVLARVMYTATILEANGSEQKRDAALDALRKEWGVVRVSVEGMIQRQARFEYFEGVGLGAVIVIPALAFGGWMAARYGGDHFSDPAAFTAAIIGGAAGAVISVTQRMTATQRTVGAQRNATNALVLDFAAPKYQKVALGALRPLVGAVFGAVVCFAVLGGLLAVETRSGKDASIALAFFAVAGFAAGFSERFATDVLERATRAVSPPDREESEPNPAPRA